MRRRRSFSVSDSIEVQREGIDIGARSTKGTCNRYRALVPLGLGQRGSQPWMLAASMTMRDDLPGIASEEAESKVLLLGNAHRLSGTDLGDLALARGLRLNLLFELLGLGRDKLGKSVAHPRLGVDVRGLRSRSRSNLGRRRWRNNRIRRFECLCPQRRECEVVVRHQSDANRDGGPSALHGYSIAIRARKRRSP